MEWLDLLPQISGGVFALGVVLFVLSLIFLRIGRKGETWRLRRMASKRGGSLLIFSFSLWVIAAALTGFTLLTSAALGSAAQDRADDDLYGVVLLTPTPAETPEPFRVKATPTVEETIR